MFASEPGEIREMIAAAKPQVLVICDDGFNYLTKMCLTNMREAAWELARIGKEAGCLVVVSSSDSTDHYEDYLNHGADFIILGEVEETLRLLLESPHPDKNALLQTDGLAFLMGETLVKTGPRKVMHELDALPPPAWDLIDFTPYRQAWKKSSGYFSLNIATTRGCPYKCNWCAKPIYGNRYNSRSPQHVVNELELLKQYTDYDHIWFCDDIFGLKPDWVQEFAALVKENKLDFSFKIQSRADLLLKDNVVRELKRAGCSQVWIGAESGSQQILDAMDKGITVEQIAQSASLLRQHGISPAFFLQFGYTGETWTDIRLTLDMLCRLVPDEVGVSVSYPLPGTAFYQRVKNDLHGKANWTDSDELLLMFKNTYSPAFYRKLQRYVHRRLRRRQGYLYVQGILRGTRPNPAWLKRAFLFPYYLLMNLSDRFALRLHASR
jgi:radical SAM superfamily enzyme YgiQ (UPF0313 family)